VNVTFSPHVSAHLPPAHRWLASPWTFFVGVFVWTWTALGLAIAFGAGMDSGLGIGLFVLGLAGPAVIGIPLAMLALDAEGRRAYWRRLVDPARIGLRWGAVIVLFVPALHALSALVDLALGGAGAAWGEAARSVASDSAVPVSTVLFALVAPLLEEVGWRGVGLERLQRTRSALVSSLIVGVLWSLWHLPAFFLPGSYQAAQGVGTLGFWLVVVGIVPLAFAFTWIYNHTGRSILAAVLFHAMINLTGEAIDLTERATTVSIGVWALAAVAIVMVWGPATFTRQGAAPGER
jgi:membrane protease YdiL (CAAX protease family)